MTGGDLILGKFPIRVLHVVTQMDRAGMESRVMDIYRNIDKSILQFDFLTHYEGTGDYDEEIKRLGGRIYKVCKNSPIKLYKNNKQIRKILHENPEYKIIHSHLNAFSTFPLLAGKMSNVQIRIAHSRTAGSVKDWKLIFREVSKFFLKSQCTHMFACSKLAGNWLFGKSAMETSKVKIINNAIDAENYVYDEEIRKNIRSNLGLNNKFVIGHVGRFAKPKNHEFLIDIFFEITKLKNDAVLVLVGVGELMGSIKNKVNSLGIGEKVMFLGKRDDVQNILQAIDIFVFPSIYEGLPGAVVEAQASGLKCIISDSISNEVAFTDLVNVISIDNPPIVWAQEIISNSNYKRRNTYDEVRKNGFDVKTVADYLTEFYISTLNVVNRK